MTITRAGADEFVESFTAKAPSNDTCQVTKQSVVDRCSDYIAACRAAGHTLDSIAARMTDMGFPISAKALSNCLARTTPKKSSRKKRSPAAPQRSIESAAESPPERSAVPPLPAETPAVTADAAGTPSTPPVTRTMGFPLRRNNFT